MNPALTLLQKQAAFFRKGLLVDSSYRAAFVLRLVGGLLPLTFFFFLQELVNEQDPRLQKYGGSYFGFVAIGVALTQYFNSALSACVKEVRNAQMSGVLEATFSTTSSPRAVVLHGAVYHFAFAALHFVVVLLAAVALFDLDLSQASWSLFVVGFTLAVAAFLGLSVLAAAFIVHSKSAEPVQLLLGGVSSFVAGAYFPISVLPDWLRGVAALIPMTHALEVLRAALLTGASFAEVGRSLASLALLAALALVAGISTLAWALGRARRDGSLGQY
jgi:ABC-2 type transport system permease protein